MDELEYAGFWKRLGSYLIDILAFLPLSGLAFWLGNTTRWYYLYCLIPVTIIGLWFHVYLVKKYGGTPGKLVMKIQIRRVDGSMVGYKEAILRYSVLFVLSNLISIAFILATLKMSDTEYFSLGFNQRTLRQMELAPEWYKPFNYLMNIWIWSEFIVILTNKKRRALHDFIAGTVVVLRPIKTTDT